MALVTSFAAFFLGQLMLGDHRTDLGAPERAARAVLGAADHMTLIAMFSMGVAAMLRSPDALARHPHAVLLPRLTDPRQRLGDEEGGPVLPDQAGLRSCRWSPHPTTTPPYGPWGGLAILLVWVAAALLVGYVLLKKRDA